MTREEAIDLLEDIKFNSSDYSRDVEALEMAIEALKQPERKKGKGRWMMNSGIGTICSNCYYKLETTGLLSKCPCCGADMGGEE